MNAGRRRLAPPLVDVVVRSLLWRNQPKARKTVRDAVRAAAAELSTSGGEVAIMLADDSAVRALNRQWRGIDKPTNVLSFPVQFPVHAGKPGGASGHLGDIVVAYETLAAECHSEGKTFLHHLTHLTVHGYLHLMGYDHQNDAEAAAMERLESTILAGLGVPDPYRAPDARAS
jgi:probable rRNA maturation factor